MEEGLLVSVITASAAGDVSGAEIEAAAAGIWVNKIQVEDVSGIDYAITIDAASQFDQAVSDITPLCLFGSKGAGSSTVRTGPDSAGTIVGAGALIPALGADASNLLAAPIFVPAGKFLTVRRRTVATATHISFQFWEKD